MIKNLALLIATIIMIGCATTKDYSSSDVVSKEIQQGGEACYYVMGQIECNDIAKVYYLNLANGKRVAVFKEEYDKYDVPINGVTPHKH